MKAVLQLFWHICLLRRSPEYVPTQSWFVATVVLANLLTSVIVSVTSTAIDQASDPLQIITRVVVSQATNGGLVWLATFLREVPMRFPATLTALFGCDLIITACFGLLMPVFLLFGEAAISILSLGFMVWSLSVAGFILARALTIKVGLGVLVALGMTVLSVATSQLAIGG